jgi:hypothetical protein
MSEHRPDLRVLSRRLISRKVRSGGWPRNAVARVNLFAEMRDRARRASEVLNPLSQCPGRHLSLPSRSQPGVDLRPFFRRKRALAQWLDAPSHRGDLRAGSERCRQGDITKLARNEKRGIGILIVAASAFQLLRADRISARWS